MKTLYMAPLSKIGVHCKLDVKNWNVAENLRKPRYKVMGRIDMFALLNCLLGASYKHVGL